MDDFDRELWRVDKYAHIYGSDYAQSYLASVAAEYASGCVWTLAGGVILLCIVYPPALIGVGVLVAAWIALSAASVLAPHARALATARAVREKAWLDKSTTEQREAAVQGMLRELGVALQTINENWTGDVCRRLGAYSAMGRAAPALALALEDIDHAVRLCAIRGLRWGHEAGDAPTEQQSWTLLCGVVASKGEETRLRVAAAVALGSGGYMDCHRALHTYLGSAEGDVRAAACHALGTLAAADPAWRQTIRHHSFDAVLAALGDGHARMRREAAGTLGTLGDPRAVKPLQRLASDPRQPAEVRTAAVGAVQRMQREATGA